MYGLKIMTKYNNIYYYIYLGDIGIGLNPLVFTDLYNLGEVGNKENVENVVVISGTDEVNKTVGKSVKVSLGDSGKEDKDVG